MDQYQLQDWKIIKMFDLKLDRYIGGLFFDMKGKIMKSLILSLVLVFAVIGTAKADFSFNLVVPPDNPHHRYYYGPRYDFYYTPRHPRYRYHYHYHRPYYHGYRYSSPYAW